MSTDRIGPVTIQVNVDTSEVAPALQQAQQAIADAAAKLPQPQIAPSGGTSVLEDVANKAKEAAKELEEVRKAQVAVTEVVNGRRGRAATQPAQPTTPPVSPVPVVPIVPAAPIDPVQAAGGAVAGTAAGSAAAIAAGATTPLIEMHHNLKNNARQMRFVLQNVAFGIEDAMTSFTMLGGGMAGLRAAIRAASNNVSVLGMLIPNPIFSSAFILGTSVLAAGLPTIINYLTQTREKADDFVQSILRLQEAAREKVKLEFAVQEGSLPSVEKTVTDARQQIALIQSDMEQTQKRREELENAYAKERQQVIELYEMGARQAIEISLMGPPEIPVPSIPPAIAEEIKRREAKMREYAEKLAQLDELDVKAAEELAKQERALTSYRPLEQQLRQNAEFERELAEERQRFRADFRARLRTPEFFNQPDQVFKELFEFYRFQAQQIMHRPDINPGRREAMIRGLEQEFRRERFDLELDLQAEQDRFQREQEEQIRRNTELARELENKLISEIHARRGIIIAYQEQENRIKELNIEENQRQRLLRLNERAMEKQLEEFDKQQARKDASVSPSLPTIEVGSREDVDLRRKFFARGGVDLFLQNDNMPFANAANEAFKQELLRKQQVIVLELRNLNQQLKQFGLKRAPIRG